MMTAIAGTCFPARWLEKNRNGIEVDISERDLVAIVVLDGFPWSPVSEIFFYIYFSFSYDHYTLDTFDWRD